jgi:hypothetical protein
MRGRRRGLRWVCAPALVTLAAALLLGTGTRADSALLANCTDSQLVPRVAQLLVAQGAPGYTRLARGKEAVVRAYLTNPTTCTVRSAQAITPVSATLNVSYSNGAAGAAPQLSNNDPLVGKLAATTQAYSTSDPYFVVPASYLAPANGDPPPKFDITFTFGLTYKRTGSTASFTNFTGTANVTATVDQRTNALRILVVPMGDRSSGSVQWSSTAETTLDNVMANAGRALPVPSGVTKELASTLTTAGIRYRISGDLLDVKALGLYKTSGSATKFCANGATWTIAQPGATGAFAGKTLKVELQERLDNYNNQNTPPADMVLGVIDGSIAWKTTDGITGGCDDGRAATPDPNARTPGELAWVRVDTGTYPTPLQMELAHTLGIVDPAIRPTLHGLEVQTDAAAPDRVYNVLQRKVIMTGSASGVVGTNDHSIMNYDTATIPYTKDNTLAFSRDWDDALCDLGGFESNAVGVTPAFASCTISSRIGTDAGVGAGLQLDMFHIDGRVSGADVTVTDANTAAGDGEFGIGAAGSPLHLLLCEGSCDTALNTRDVPLSLTGQAPVDEHHTGGPTGPTTPDTFSALISLQSPLIPTVTFTCAELKLGVVTKFDSCASDPAPDIESTTVNPGTIVTSFPMPVEAGNGRAIAFDGTHLYTTLSSGTTVYKQTTSGASAGSFDVGTTLGALAWNAGIGRLYGGSYTGDAKVYEINPADGAKTEKFTFSPPQAGCLFIAGFIDGLEYRPTAGNLALSGDACDTVFIKTLTGGDVSSFPTDNNSGITTDGADGLWLARLTRGDVPYTTFTHVNATTGAVLGKELILPDYLAEDLAYDSSTFAPTCVLWMNQATFDSGPPEIRAVAVPCAGGSVTGADTVGVQTTNADFVTLFAVCGAEGQATDPNVEKFSLGTYVPNEEGQTITPFTDDRFCVNATIIAEASNGWTSTGLTDDEGSADVDPPSQSPVVNIAAPFNGAKFRIGDRIHYEGYATDQEDGASAALIASLKWYDNDNLIAEGTGNTSFDLQVPSTASVGSHTIKLEATDANDHTSFTTVTIQIRPRVCSSSSGCP